MLRKKFFKYLGINIIFDIFSLCHFEREKSLSTSYYLRFIGSLLITPFLVVTYDLVTHFYNNRLFY